MHVCPALVRHSRLLSSSRDHLFPHVWFYLSSPKSYPSTTPCLTSAQRIRHVMHIIPISWGASGSPLFVSIREELLEVADGVVVWLRPTVLADVCHPSSAAATVVLAMTSIVASSAQERVFDFPSVP